MWDVINGIIIIPIMGALTYGLIRQFEETIAIIKFNNGSSRKFIGQIICSIAYFVFFLFYIVNNICVLFGRESILFTSELTSMFCVGSIVVFILTRYSLSSKS